MFPAMLMPLLSSGSNVALPFIRETFGLQADVTAWITIAFTLPFMIFMPVYGRLSDAVGRRRLILAGIVIGWIGSVVVVGANGLAGLMVGRAIQGAGLASMLPLSLAILTSVHPAETRGKALGTWSSIGPLFGFIGPVVAGFLVHEWGWRGAYTPSLVSCAVAFVAVMLLVPPGLSTVRPDFWRTFDWAGVLLLAGLLICTLFYLSSGPITGVAPLRDMRLLGGAALFAVAFLLWERRHQAPFLPLALFANKTYAQGTFAASLRMVSMGSLFFLLPLYLVDVRDSSPAQLGLMLTIVPGAMASMVRVGGQIADRWGSRGPVIIGFAVQIVVLTALWQLPATAPLWLLVLLLIVQGLGVGIKLAPLHAIALGTISDEQMGTAAGFYSMNRFIGQAVTTALAGVLLQLFLDQGLPSIDAYQRTFLCFVPFAILGVVAILPYGRTRINRNGEW